MTTTADSTSESTTPRHRASGTGSENHWWRAHLDPTRSRTRRAADSEQDETISFPGTGTLRTTVGPWVSERPDHTDGSDGVASEPLDGGDRPEDSPTGPTGDRTDDRSVALATTFPPDTHAQETGLRAYLLHTAILSGRQLTVWTRDKKVLIQSIVFPALSMVMFKVVLGDAITAATGVNSAYGTVPLVVLVGAMFGSLIAGIRLRREQRTGLLTRLYVLPVHKGADLSARLISELSRILVATIALTTFGMLIGWRFDQGLLPALGIFLIPLLFGAAFSTVMLTVAMSSTNLPLVQLMSLLSSLLMFFNSGFAPVYAYPQWIQPIVREQPMTCAIDSMRALALGGPVAESLTKTILWAVVVIAVFFYPAVRGFRRAAATRT